MGSGVSVVGEVPSPSDGSSVIRDDLDQPTTTLAGQPILSSAIRALDRLIALGEPVDPALKEAVTALADRPADDLAVELRRLLAPHLLLEFRVGPRGPESVEQLGGPAPLTQGGWRSFLIAAVNPGGLESGFEVGGGGSDVTWASGMVTRPYLPDRIEHASTIRDRWWYELRLDGSGALTGRVLEFFVLSVYSRDAGRRTAPISIGRSPGPKLAGDRQGDSWEQTQRRRIADRRVDPARSSRSTRPRPATSSSTSATTTAGPAWRRSSSATTSAGSTRPAGCGWRRTCSSRIRCTGPPASSSGSPRAGTRSRPGGARNTGR